MAKKLVLVKIKRNQSGGKTSYTYPPEYNASKIDVMCYESSLPENYTKVVDRGNQDEFVIGAVEETDLASFTKSADIIEITKTEAETLGASWTKQTEKITDQTAVLTILAKVARNETLTLEEQKAIDPTDPTPGITKSKSFTEELSERNIVDDGIVLVKEEITNLATVGEFKTTAELEQVVTKA